MTNRPLGLALIGAGRIGTNHATIVARQVPGARLVAVADPVEAAAKRLHAFGLSEDHGLGRNFAYGLNQ